jgi:succinate-semialdehyde dehydrogenase/glutarate-semialdehyde dehydrogenase
MFFHSNVMLTLSTGFGREGSKLGIDEYMVTKMVTLGGMGQPLQGE